MILFNRLLGSRSKRTTSRAKAKPRQPVLSAESLEPILLMAAGCPVISGYVFLDQNTGNPALTNNGLLDPGEPGEPGASVQLLDANNHLVATTTTAADGSYSFVSTNGQPAKTAAASVTTPAQSLAIGNPAQNSVQTNFANQPLTPALQLFDPALGTLTTVTVQPTASFKSNTTSENLSSNSPATITPSVQGTYDLEGLSQPITGTFNQTGAPMTVGPYNPANPAASTATFPTMTATNSPAAMTLTDPASLAFYTASAGRATVTPTLSATSTGSGTLPNGNLTTTIISSTSATLAVSFTYTPFTNCLKPGTYRVVQSPEVPNLTDGKESQNNVVVAPTTAQPQTLTVNLGTTDSTGNNFAKLAAPVPATYCPALGSLVRVGIHRQTTNLELTFSGAIDPVQAKNVTNYSVVASNGARITITSAVYDASSNTVTLTPARWLNAHYHFNLSVSLPCIATTTVAVPFGGKGTLVGFNTPRGTFVPIVNGVVGGRPRAIGRARR